MHAGYKRAQPVSEVNDILPRDAREEILGPTREPRDLVRKDWSTNDQLVIVKNYAVDGHRDFIYQQAIRQALRLTG